VKPEPHTTQDSQVYEGRYRIWHDGHTYRWSLISWPDDGIGVPNHGGSPSKLGAMAACRKHRKLREDIEEDRKKGIV